MDNIIMTGHPQLLQDMRMALAEKYEDDKDWNDSILNEHPERIYLRVLRPLNTIYFLDEYPRNYFSSDGLITVVLSRNNFDYVKNKLIH